MNRIFLPIMLIFLSAMNIAAKEYYPTEVDGCYAAMLVGSGKPAASLSQKQSGDLGLLKINSRAKGLYQCCTKIGKAHGKISRARLKQKIGDDDCGEKASVYEIKRQMINASIAAYPGSCACPYSRARNGNKCGKRSAYSKKGGHRVLCYESDISDDMIRRHQKR